VTANLARTIPGLLSALAPGGVVAIAVYLPVYLAAVFGLGWFRALAVTGVALGAVARLVGGWWTDRRLTVRLLMFCCAVAAGLCLVAALEPKLWWLTAPVIAPIAVCDGLASGALIALIGKAARGRALRAGAQPDGDDGRGRRRVRYPTGCGSSANSSKPAP
jgi:nitrate/nitrite transporter NarK